MGRHSFRFPSRPVLLATFLILLAAPCVAQPLKLASSFDELKSLVKPGDTVTVVERTGRQSTGKISDLSTTDLVLMIANERRELGRTEVSVVYHKRQDSVLNGAIFGLVIGAGLGMMGAEGCTNNFGCRGGYEEFMALWGSVGAGVGAGVDALITKRQVVYRRPPGQAARLPISPMVGPGRHGLLVSIAF